MGHSNVSVTLNVYASVFNRYKDSELEKVNKYYINNDIFEDNPTSNFVQFKNEKNSTGSVIESER